MTPVWRPGSSRSNKHNSTAVAFSEKRAKFAPLPSHVVPRGYGCPGQVSIKSSMFECDLSLKPFFIARHCFAWDFYIGNTPNNTQANVITTDTPSKNGAVNFW